MIERLKELFHELNCIQYAEKGKEFPLASGGTSYYKIVCDPLFENAETRYILGKLGYGMFKKIEEDCDIVGVLGGGYDFSKLVAKEAGMEAVGVNPHNGQVIGKVVRPYQCYFEDVVTLGGSILKSRKILGINDEKDNKAKAIVNRQQGGEKNLSDNGIDLESLLTRTGLGIQQRL